MSELVVSNSVPVVVSNSMDSSVMDSNMKSDESKRGADIVVTWVSENVTSFVSHESGVG